MIIRPITADDLGQLIPLHIASRRLSEEGIICDSDLDRDTAEDFQNLWKKWLSDDEIYTACTEDQDIIKGFCLYGRIKTRPAFDRGVVPKFGAEIYALYVDPQYLHQGIGKALFHNAIDDLIVQKHAGLVLWTMKKNKNACAFYDTLGGERVGKQRVEMGQSSWTEESCFAWKDIKKIV